MDNRSRIKVALAKCADYDSLKVEDTVRNLLETIDCRPSPGTSVLVKPNLLAPKPPDYLPCTHPSVVREVCRYLLDLGAKVRVGDSPTFGQGKAIAGLIGLTEALSDLPVQIINLDRPRLIRLSFGGRMAISRTALENDLIVNVPKLKSHHQTRITGAVKNVYGCSTGLAKPVQHLLYGDRGGRFEKMILDIWKNLPPTVSLMDAVIAMHGHGPTNGDPYSLGLLAASPSAIALDTAVMSMLGLRPEEAPLWKMSQELGLPGARQEDLAYPLETIGSFSAKGFEIPSRLFPLSFRPFGMLRFWIKGFLGA
jgi:uncharacterized protein (DUF362 family)